MARRTAAAAAVLLVVVSDGSVDRTAQVAKQAGAVADGQHDPSEVPKLVETMRSTGAGLVIGARFAGTGEYQVRGPRR